MYGRKNHSYSSIFLGPRILRPKFLEKLFVQNIILFCAEVSLGQSVHGSKWDGKKWPWPKFGLVQIKMGQSVRGQNEISQRERGQTVQLSKLRSDPKYRAKVFLANMWLAKVFWANMWLAKMRYSQKIRWDKKNHFLQDVQTVIAILSFLVFSIRIYFCWTPSCVVIIMFATFIGMAFKHKRENTGRVGFRATNSLARLLLW